MEGVKPPTYYNETRYRIFIGNMVSTYYKEIMNGVTSYQKYCVNISYPKKIQILYRVID